MTEKDLTSFADSTSEIILNERRVEEESKNGSAVDPSKATQDIPISYSTIDTSPKQPEKQVEIIEEPPARDITGWKWAVVVLSIFSSTFLFALDNTIIADIQPIIVLHFNDVQNLTWLSVAFLVGASATNLIWGKIFGQFNAKWTYILCVVLFELGSAICGSASSMDAIIIGRVVCGVGGSGMYVGVMTLLAATTTIHERPMYVGGTGLTWGLGTVLGPVIGGVFSNSSAGWRWAFYINLCIGAAFAPVYVFMLPNKIPRPGVSLLNCACEMDYVGCFLTLGAFASGVIAISLGGVTYKWNSGQIIGLFCSSGVLFTLLGLQQIYSILTTTSRRVFPVEFLKSRTMLILFAITAAGGTTIFVPIYMIPIFFQFIRNDTALEAGVRILPFIILMIFAVIGNGAILSTYGYYMPWYMLGGLLCIMGGALMYTVDTETSVARVYSYSIIIGFGTGLFAQASFSVAQAVVDSELITSAIGFIACAQISGVTIALAIANSVFLNRSQNLIAEILPGTPFAEVQQAIAGAGSAFFTGLSDVVKTEVLEAIATAIGQTYILVVAAGAFTTVLSLGMKRERLFTAIGEWSALS